MSALTLRVIACITMLIDHIGLLYGIDLFRYIGRISFPIFAFLIANGYGHTSSRVRYLLRLAVFALLSQVPFSLMCYGRLWSNHGNVLVTFVMAFICLWLTDLLRTHRVGRWFAVLPFLGGLCLYRGLHFQSDYGIGGVLLVMCFYLCNPAENTNRPSLILSFLVFAFCDFGLSLAKQLALLILNGTVVMPVITQWDVVQLFGALSLPFLFLYDGTKGKLPKNPVCAKLTQYGFYLFYPLHMLLLVLVRYF